MKLEQLYYNPKSPAAYASEQALYKLAKQSSKKVKLQDVSLFVCLFVCLFALRPKSTAMVIAGRSVHLTTLFPGQA